MNRASIMIATMLALGESMFIPDPSGRLMPNQRELKKQRKFGEPVGPPLTLTSCDPSQHNTLRYEQTERHRKITRRANRLKFKRYRRATT